ncbi:astacin [Teladorsagia circumcincta]|uniref:Metalloendopeptidase n=1 Tax=Teladorsagia circumcincta TaxID=45464 RepID=A0A2G9UQB8_TELCI|nr:astacin [Teladorsagia circumcincta]
MLVALHTQLNEAAEYGVEALLDDRFRQIFLNKKISMAPSATVEQLESYFLHRQCPHCNADEVPAMSTFKLRSAMTTLPMLALLVAASCMSNGSLNPTLDRLLQFLKLLKRKTDDEAQEVGDTIMEVNMKSGVASTLFEGDITLSKEQQEQIAADLRKFRSKRQAFNEKRYPARRWSSGLSYMLYELNHEAETTFRKAAQLWMDNTCINFTEYKYPPRIGVKIPANIIIVHEGDGCSSDVGRNVDPVPQLLSLGKGCESIGNAAHEIGHALGFFHTHTRHDRDQYVTVDEENIKHNWSKQFKMLPPTANYNYNLTYDYGSVMHYGARSPAAAIQAKPVIVPKDRNYIETLGSDLIAFYDILMMNMFYECTGT